MPTDTLSDLVAAVQLRAQIFHAVSLHSPYAVAFPEPHSLTDEALEPGQQVCFFMVTQGSVGVELPDHGFMQLEQHEVALLPRGHALALAHGPGQAHEPISALRDDIAGYPPKLTLDGVEGFGEGLCGMFRFRSHLFNPLADALSQSLILRADPAGREWLATALAPLLDESATREPGGAAITHALLLTLLITGLRELMATDQLGGFIGALGQPGLARALDMIHADPGYAWTNSELARRSGVARKQFVEYFQAWLGRTPLQYLHLWRVELAAQALARGESDVDALAARLGWGNAGKLDASFVEHFGRSPRDWQRAQDPARREQVSAPPRALYA